MAGRRRMWEVAGINFVSVLGSWYSKQYSTFTTLRIAFQSINPSLSRGYNHQSFLVYEGPLVLQFFCSGGCIIYLKSYFSSLVGLVTRCGKITQKPEIIYDFALQLPKRYCSGM